MDALEWQQAKGLVVATHALPRAEREAYLINHCADSTLRAQVEAILKGADEAPDAWLQRLDVDDIEGVEERSEIAIDTHLGPYTIIEPLGSGGMGQVFLALDSRLRRKVALKCVLSRTTALYDRRSQILREARAAATINHPNVATVHDVIEHDGRTFIVMEYVEGENLATLLRRQRFSAAAVIELGRQLASALAAAHRKGIIHRDLKPANIQLKPDGTVKVLDFGVAKTPPTFSAGFTSGTTTNGVPITGIQPGTPAYMSPEQLLGREIDARSDLFSLGIILYELVNGQRPLETEPLYPSVALTNLPAIDPLMPPGLGGVVAKLLALDPSLRFQSASEVETALSQLDPSRRQSPAPVVASSPSIATDTERGTGTGILWWRRRILPTISVGVSMVALALIVGSSGWISSSGELLTIAKPTGGTIRSAGITCGTNGSECSTTVATGDPVELEVQPDEGFAFRGFTGDCASTGRTEMSRPRTCGARFEALAAGAKAVVWRLTITPAKGGTILAPGGITCGTVGSRCSADLPGDHPVSLLSLPDPGYTFLDFSGDCPSSGQTVMTGPRTCSATFSPAVVEAGLSSLPAPVARPSAPPPSIATSQPTSFQPPQMAADAQLRTPMTARQHSEIRELFEEYCAGLESFDPAAIQKVYPSANVRSLQIQFRQYKSLTCTITRAPEFIQLDAIAGVARVEAAIEQTIEMITGGAPRTIKFLAVATLSRPSATDRWHIETLQFRPIAIEDQKP